jgi:fumarylacetoacetate (FAA) hydrolase
MRLATLRDGTRDGALIVVRPDGKSYRSARSIAPTMQAALDDWDRCEPLLRALSEAAVDGALPLDLSALHSPLPRAYEWIDGSAYLNHVRLVRKARGAEPPPTLETDPLIYQGGSGTFLGPRDPMPLLNPAWGLDFESEVAVVLGDTPAQTSARDAAACVRLVMLVNDVTLRNLIPDELAKGFGFFCSKPSTAFSPFAITPDELGDAWKDGRVHLRLKTELDGVVVGDTDAGPEMHFSFFDLIAHITKSRAFTAGTILGSGTVSNTDPARGISCLAERRTREVLESGKASTPFLAEGQVVRISMADTSGRDLFGDIVQRVVAR